jgi:hypothetical protein
MSKTNIGAGLSASVAFAAPLLLLFAVSLIAVTPAFASDLLGTLRRQSSDGRISPVPFARIEACPPGETAGRCPYAYTNADGNFRISMSGGNYTLSVQSQDGRALLSQDVSVPSTGNKQLDLIVK